MSDLDVYRASRRANVHGALKTVYRSTGPLRWILLAVLFMPCGCHRRQAAETVLSKDETYLAGFGSGGIPLDYEASVVGSDKCANCHAEQCEQQATHHMAHTGAMIGPANQEKIFSEERLALPFKQYPGDAPFPGRYEKTEEGFFSQSTKAMRHHCVPEPMSFLVHVTLRCSQQKKDDDYVNCALAILG